MNRTYMIPYRAYENVPKPPLPLFARLSIVQEGIHF